MYRMGELGILPIPIITQITVQTFTLTPPELSKGLSLKGEGAVREANL